MSIKEPRLLSSQVVPPHTGVDDNRRSITTVEECVCEGEVLTLIHVCVIVVFRSLFVSSYNSVFVLF